MKFAIFTVMILAVSCGEYQVGVGGSQVGLQKPFTPAALSSTDQTNLQNLCNQLYLNPTSIEGTSHSFHAIQNDCGAPVTTVTDAPVILTEIQNGRYKNQATGLDFFFPEFDSRTTGVLAEICANLNEVTSPRLIGSADGETRDAQWVSTLGISEANCPRVSGEVCLQFDTGSRQNDQYIIHTSEYIRFKVDTNAAKKGFVSYRKKVSRSYCSNQDTVTTQALLK